MLSKYFTPAPFNAQIYSPNYTYPMRSVKLNKCCGYEIWDRFLQIYGSKFLSMFWINNKYQIKH
jgi:hypothetical protein